MIISALFLSLFACKGNPCQSYVSAFNDCYETNDPESAARLTSDYCTDFDETSDDYFTCLADSYESGDCITDTGIAAIDTDVAACTL